jgi:hypothetical protein
MYADASYASREGERSQTGYCAALGEGSGCFYVKSQKQSIVTWSSAEAEHVALYHAVSASGHGARTKALMFMEVR